MVKVGRGNVSVTDIEASALLFKRSRSKLLATGAPPYIYEKMNVIIINYA